MFTALTTRSPAAPKMVPAAGTHAAANFGQTDGAVTLAGRCVR